MSIEELENWIGWLQARIPALKESYNVYWLKQAMEGYKKGGVNPDKEIQTEDIVDIINENYRLHTGMNESILHAAEDIIELFKPGAGSTTLKNCLCLLDSTKCICTKKQSVMPNSESFIKDREIEDVYVFGKETWLLSDTIEQFANLCVKQEKEEWEKERVLYEEEIKYKSGVLSNNRHTFNEMQKEIEALKSNLYSKKD